MQHVLDLLYQTTPLQWVVAFFILLVTDIAWAKYSIATAQDNNPTKAANWAVVLFGLGGLAVVGYTTNPILLLPSAVGAWCGTNLGVRMSKKKDTSKEAVLQ
jgi:hypothetical protein